jgi:hypothetical protein
MTTFLAETIVALHERIQEAADILTRVAHDLVACVPTKPEAPLGEIGVETPEDLRAQLQLALSRCIDTVKAVRGVLDA